MEIPQGGRFSPPRNRPEQGNGAWAGRQQGNNLNRQPNQAVLQNQNNQPQSWQQRQNGNPNNRKRRRQMED
jgi:hypothetical protein